ncbi:MAG: hypothetical protein K1X28_00815 [Parachlamydiales bacterium]|nr:hypothetical protein [Parachlamydiales bacterium]
MAARPVGELIFSQRRIETLEIKVEGGPKIFCTTHTHMSLADLSKPGLSREKVSSVLLSAQSDIRAYEQLLKKPVPTELGAALSTWTVRDAVQQALDMDRQIVRLAEEILLKRATEPAKELVEGKEPEPPPHSRCC